MGGGDSGDSGDEVEKGGEVSLKEEGDEEE